MLLGERSKGVGLTFANCFLDELGKRKTDFQDVCDGDRVDEDVCMMKTAQVGRSRILDRVVGQDENSREDEESPYKDERKRKKKMVSGRTSEGTTTGDIDDVVPQLIPLAA